MNAQWHSGLPAATLAALVACAQRAAPATAIATPAPQDPLAQLAPSDTARQAEADAEAQLAELELAVNQLRPVIHQCWGAAAADDFRLQGKLVLQLIFPTDFSGIRPVIVPGVSVSEDTAGDDVLTACVVAVVKAYAWSAVMLGSAFELPFAFSAPDGQFVIDRRFVKPRLGSALAVATLMDAKNTGSRAASVAEVGFAAGSDSQWGLAERDEAWVALTSGAMVINGKPQTVVEGDVFLVAPGEFRRFAASGAMTFAVVFTPGGPEGTLRAGALPSGTFANAPAKSAPVRYFAAANGEPKRTANGIARVVVDSSKTKTPFNVSLLEMTAGAALATHAHPEAAELVYMQAGEGELTVGKVQQRVGPSHMILIPAGQPHAFVATTAVKAIQWYVPSKQVLR